MSDNLKPTGSFIQTWTGKKFDFMNPESDSIVIEDIAHALSLTCRFGGHTSRFYSVADHSVNVARLLAWEGHSIPTIQVGLLHDSAESFLGDVVTPLKKMLPAIGEMEKNISSVILQRFCVDTLNVDFDAIKLSDQIMLVAEAETLFINPPIDNWTERYPKVSKHLRLHISQTPKEAEYYFLAAAKLLLDVEIS